MKEDNVTNGSINDRSNRSTGRRVRQIAAPLGALALLVGPFAALSSAQSALPSAKTLIAEMKSAISTQSSVHLVINAVQIAPRASETMKVDANKTVGHQSSVSGNENAQVILTTGGAYFSGNSSGLTAFFSLPADDLALVGTKWVAIKPGAAQYKTFANALTIKNLLSNLTPSAATFKVATTTFHSVHAYVISWTATNSGTTLSESLYLPTTGRKLPLGETAISGSVTDSSQLTNWGEVVHVSAPTNTIAITKLHTS